ncbi:transcription factor TFIIIB component B'' homolog isoform X2 [Ooceraea biroi]|nr:transcription factor TFIIIB component B'' homolog isoform X2 [Ooceraea biroi]
MRRARIKAMAAVPVRKKVVQDTSTSTDKNNVFNMEQKKDTPDALEQNATKTAAEVEVQKNDLHNTVALEQKDKDTNVQEKIVEDEQIKAKLTDVKILAEKSESQESAREKPGRDSCEAYTKSGFQEPCSKTNSDSKESCVQVKKSSLESSPQKKSDPEESRAKAKSELYVQVKPDPQKPCTPTKLCAQAKQSSSEPCDQVDNNSEKFGDHVVQEKILPVSPTKIIQNRPCFMRPIPRLDSSGRIRKNSIQGSGASASESEDEHGKKTMSLTPSRVRNDSVCSVQSNKDSNPCVNDNQTNSPRVKTMQKRRMVISESARKLAEARREFLLKHENKTPDRSQLKMYDLIYYNPITNPMKKSTEAQKPIVPQLTETPEEEDEDDPVAMPVPQVKVGPDGQLIIDEQSLVIESSNTKRAKEIMSTDVIIEDENCHSGGFYKKRQRGKDWPKWETFKFYRVLNVVGTDFLLMQTLFPNRTRQEIKQKYKKEERVNRHLIEKALKYHQEFDTEMLEEQLAMLQELESIQSETKKSEKPKNEQSMTKAARKRRHRLVAKSIGECESSSVNDQEDGNATDEIDSEASGDETSDVRHQRTKRKSRARKLRRLDFSDKSDDNSSHASSKEPDSDSDPEIYQ